MTAEDAHRQVRSPPAGLPADTMLFTGGGQYDAKARQADQGVPGLYYLRARYYDPSIGRFLSQDPLPFVPPVSSSAWGQTTPSTGGAPLATTCTTASAARPEQ